MTIEEAIKKNPFDHNKGNKSAYCRYLRYNVDGWYNLDSKEVLRRWQSEDRMTIDKAVHHLYTYSSTLGSCQTTQDQHEEAKRVAINTMRKYQQLRANYENRLKADMVTLLDELDLELYEKYEDTDLVKVKYIRQSIQEKIDKLKGEQGNANSN